MSGNPFKLIKNKGIPDDDEMVEFRAENPTFIAALEAAGNDPKKIKALQKMKVFEKGKQKGMKLNTQKAIRWLSGIVQDADVNFLVESMIGVKKFVGDVATDFKKYFDESSDPREGARAIQVARTEESLIRDNIRERRNETRRQQRRQEENDEADEADEEGAEKEFREFREQRRQQIQQQQREKNDQQNAKLLLEQEQQLEIGQQLVEQERQTAELILKQEQERQQNAREAQERLDDFRSMQEQARLDELREAQVRLDELKAIQRQAKGVDLQRVDTEIDAIIAQTDNAVLVSETQEMRRIRQQQLSAEIDAQITQQRARDEADDEEIEQLGRDSRAQEMRRIRQQQLSAEIDAQTARDEADDEEIEQLGRDAEDEKEILELQQREREITELEDSIREMQDPLFVARNAVVNVQQTRSGQDGAQQEAARSRISQAQQLAAENNAQAQGVREIVDEPRPQAPGTLGDLPSSFNEAFESGDTVPDRISQLEQIFEQIKPHLNDPALKEDLRERIAIVRENLEEHKKKPLPIRIMKGVLAFGKEVLAFVAAGPLPVPLEVRAGAASLLAGIVGTEQLAAAVRGETTDLNPIRTAIEHGTGIPELAPVMDVASDVLDVAEFGLQVREEFVRAQQGNSAVNSNPVPSHLTGTALVDTRAQQQMILNDGVIDSQGISVRVSEPVGPIEPLPEDFEPLPEDFEPFVGEGERLGSIDDGVNVPGGPGGPGGPSETVVLKGPEDILQITQGRDPNSTSYVNPIHLDAIGIYFKSSSNPKWDSNLLTDRNSRYVNIDPESTRSYLLQQTRQLFNAYKFDLLIPKLLYDENSSIEDVIKENHEILQLWAKLKGISCLPPCEEEKPTKVEEPVESETDKEIKEGTASSGHHQGGIVDPTRPIVSRASEGGGLRHPKDKTMRFQPSNVSGIRIRQVVTDADIEANISPSLAEVVTAGGAPPLYTRSNMTRGFSHAGPVARGQIMNGLRQSVISTQSSEPARSGYARTGKGLDQAHSSSRFNIRI